MSKLLVKKDSRWNQTLQWVLHSFRHGAAIDAFLASAGDSEYDRIRRLHHTTGHMTVGMMRFYSETNQNRILMEQRRLEASNFSKQTGGERLRMEFRINGTQIHARQQFGSAVVMKQVLSDAGMKNKKDKVKIQEFLEDKDPDLDV